MVCECHQKSFEMRDMGDAVDMLPGAERLHLDTEVVVIGGSLFKPFISI
jgi:hypothetical protein